MLDLDDVGPEHRQLIGRERAGQHVRDVDDADPLEGSGHGGLLEADGGVSRRVRIVYRRAVAAKPAARPTRCIY
jgi:hypothetical protein